GLQRDSQSSQGEALIAEGRDLAPSDPWHGFKRKHPTSNIQHSTKRNAPSRLSAIGCWALDVRCSMFCPYPPRRVMGAWWPSRSSKPLSARSTSRGMFDSYPLRQHLRPYFELC